MKTAVLLIALVRLLCLLCQAQSDRTNDWDPELQATQTTKHKHSQLPFVAMSESLDDTYRFIFDGSKETPVLTTPWTDKVDSANPLPEYPRPQMVRRKWQNLNGVWEFETAGTVSDNAPEPPFNRTLDRRIVVPFPVEAPLSGIHEHHAGIAHMVYRRNFTIPSDWHSERILLHFGAVDWEATVYVNGQLVGRHRGGFNKFNFDITNVLVENCVNQLLVSVFDPSEFGHIALGKQRLHPPRHPSSIWYTSASGIWQTVWLEPVPAAHIARLDLIPDVDNQQLSVTVAGSTAAQGMAVEARAKVNGSVVGAAQGVVGAPFHVSIPQPHLWSPDTPFLYDLDVYLLGQHASQQPPHDPLLEGSAAESTARALLAEPELERLSDISVPGGAGAAARRSYVDHVHGYFGMRKISLGRVGDEKNPRVFLNDQFVFQLGMLDQGYWPDGIYTAPTDEALASDITFAKSMGYNMLRKHIKVEPDRWYYHADRLGMLVWQDMPSMFWEDDSPALPALRPATPTAAEAAQWEGEFADMISQHYSFPAIVVYVVFNEGWGQYDTHRVTKKVQAMDPSRLFNPASGWRDADVGDLVDMHKYVGPDSPLPTPNRAAVLGEFGGLGYRTDGHLWIPQEAFCYEMEDTVEELQERYVGLMAVLKALMLNTTYSLSGAVYTEVTDVEAEINGWLTYDRRVNKAPRAAEIASVHRDLIKCSVELNV